MPSSYTSNLGIELPVDGEQDGTWGDVVNDNMNILDRAVNGVLTLTLSGTSSTLSTSDGALSNGQYKLLVLGGTPSGTHTITISPNDAQKIYYVRNTTAQSVIFTQGSGGNVTIATGDSGIIYTNGAGAGAAVVNITNDFAMNSVNITGGTVNGAVIGGTTPAAVTGTTGAFSSATVTNNLTVDTNTFFVNATTNRVGVGTAAPTTKVELSGSTGPTATFTGSISGTTLDVSAVVSGTIAVGDRVYETGVEWNTYITALGTGTGGVGTYTLNNSQTFASATLYTSPADANVLRITNTDGSEQRTQTVGAVEFFGSDASTPGAGVKGYVSVIAESTSPDYAMLFGTSDNVASTVAVERMRITSAGNVGVGTNAPAAKLDVYGGSNVIRSTTADSTANYLSFYDATGRKGYFGYGGATEDMTLANERSGFLRFITNNGTRMQIDTAGNVGIGTITPAEKLDVSGNIRATVSGTATVAALSGDATNYSALRLRQTATESRIENSIAGTGAYAPITVYAGGFERMRVDTAGQIGIGGANFGKSGQVLKSAGASAAPAWASAATLLGQITTTSGATQTLSGLDLTGYSFLYITYNNVSGSAGASYLTLASLQMSGTTSAASQYFRGITTVDLLTGVFTSTTTYGSSTNPMSDAANVYAGDSNITTGATSLTFGVNTGAFDAGAILVYGM